LLGLGSTRVLTYHEVVFCQPAKEMLASGQWLIPTIAGVPFLDKPPATAWLVSLAMTVFQSHSEWVVRLPSAFAGVLSALAIAGLAARFLGPRIGIIAGLMQATTYYVLQFGRLAESDMPLVAAVTAAMCLFALAAVESPAGRRTDRWLPWAFHAATGAAFIVKGPIALVFIGGACLAYLLVERDRQVLRFCLHPGGLTLLLLLVLAWPVAAYLRYPPIFDAWLLHNLGRFSGELGRSRPIWFYLTAVPVATLPWSPFAILAAWRLGKQSGALAPIWRFSLCWLAPGLLFLSASAFKSRHYAAPLLPPLTMLAAVGLNDFLQWRAARERGKTLLYAGTWMALCAAVTAAVCVWRPKGYVGIIVVLQIIAAGAAALAWLGGRKLVVPQLAALFATAWLAAAGVLTMIVPYHDSYRDQAILARRVNQEVPAGAKLYLLRLPDNQVTYYLSPQLIRLDHSALAIEALRADRSPQVYALAPEFLANRLSKLGEVEVLGRCASVNRYLKPNERMTFVRLTRDTAVAAAAVPRSGRGAR
jgi:4-amino-4-deoxy-L-arabinose transferase-like glycosyltransferase